MVFPSAEAEMTLRAKPSLILRATSYGVTPSGYSFLLPSGKVISIMFSCVYVNGTMSLQI